MEDGIPDSPEMKSAVKMEDAKVELDSKEAKTVMPLQQKRGSKFSDGADNGVSKSNEACVSSKREQDDDEEEEHNLVEDNLQGDNKTEIQLDEDTEIDESQVWRKFPIDYTFVGCFHVGRHLDSNRSVFSQLLICRVVANFY